MGNPLSVTLFSSVYVDRMLWPEPKKIEEACFLRTRSKPNGHGQPSMLQEILRAYCLALIKTCDFVLDRISRQTYYEVSSRFASFVDHVRTYLFCRKKTSVSIFTTGLC